MGSATSTANCWCQDGGAGGKLNCPEEIIEQEVHVVKVASCAAFGGAAGCSEGRIDPEVAVATSCGASSAESTEAPTGNSRPHGEVSDGTLGSSPSAPKPGALSDSGDRSVTLSAEVGADSPGADQQLNLLDGEDLGNVPEEHRAACVEMAKALGPDGVAEARAFLVPGESLLSCYLRFLKPHSFDAVAAASHLQADLEWRKRARPAVLADMPPEEVAGCEARLLDEYMPTWHQGYDRSGRPLIFACYGRFRFKPMMAQTSVDKLLQLYVHQAERSARLCGEQSKKLGKNIYNMVIVVDADGWDASNVRQAASYTWAKGMAKIDQEHYPERLGRMYVINAPKVFMYFWKVVQFFLRDEMKNRVEILSTRDQWFPRLCEIADVEQLPPEYGGCGPRRGHG